MSDTRFPWRTVLFASVALNLLVIGAGVGAWLSGVRVEREASDSAVVERLPGPRAFLRALPAETRAAMRQELAESWQETRDTRQAAIQARRDAFAALGQEPYDAERVGAAFERLRAADQSAIGVFQNNVIEAFGELTPEQRHEALEALRTAVPAARRAGIPAGLEEGDAAPAQLSPEQRQTIQERREERRERWRQRREERLQQRQQITP